MYVERETFCPTKLDNNVRELSTLYDKIRWRANNVVYVTNMYNKGKDRTK